MLVGWPSPSPPEPRFTRSYGSQNVTLKAKAQNAKKQEISSPSHDEISLILTLAVPAFYSFPPVVPLPLFSGNSLHCTSPSDNPSSPSVPAGARGIGPFLLPEHSLIFLIQLLVLRDWTLNLGKSFLGSFMKSDFITVLFKELFAVSALPVLCIINCQVKMYKNPK